MSQCCNCYSLQIPKDTGMNEDAGREVTSLEGNFKPVISLISPSFLVEILEERIAE